MTTKHKETTMFKIALFGLIAIFAINLIIFGTPFPS